MKREKHNHASAHAHTHASTHAHTHARIHKNSFNKLTTTREKLEFKINFVTWH